MKNERLALQNSMNNFGHKSRPLCASVSPESSTTLLALLPGEASPQAISSPARLVAEGSARAPTCPFPSG